MLQACSTMREEPRYVEVAVALPVPRTFSYRLSSDDEMPAVGKRLLVPFGRRQVVGYMLGTTENREGLSDIKTVGRVLDERPLFPAAMLPFFKWTAEYYLHPLGEVIKSALPGGVNPSERLRFELTAEGRRRLADASIGAADRCALSLMTDGPVQLQRFFRNDISLKVLNRLESAGWVLRKKNIARARTAAKTERCVRIHPGASGADGLSESKRRLFERVSTAGQLAVSELKVHTPRAGRLVRELVRSGHLDIFYKTVYRDPFGELIPRDVPPVLNSEQTDAVRAVVRCLGDRYGAFLLTGVTGSGKTEVYLHLAAETIARRKTVLILVPEIALISQMERRFRARFGECIAVFHSGLSDGERYDQWQRVLDQKASIGVGARSAVFAPFERLGLIVVDEEHDGSYKQESGLRYNARDLALVRAKLEGAVALLGSATPSVQSYHNVKTGKFQEIRLTRRVAQRPLPAIELVDLRRFRDVRGVDRYLTPVLLAAMREALARGEQVLLFLNRRGFANFPVCAACGEAVRCKNCDISMTLHRQSNAYHCHYCGSSRAAASVCSRCGAARVKLLGMGTERVEARLQSLFPDARVARMDSDSIRRKGALLDLLKKLHERKIDILVGTQMVAKGHDFPNITLVGIVCADLSLSFPDFRSGERTFQMLAQVAGRAGRGDLPGRVVLQTYTPEHFSITAAQQQDFEAFYEEEIQSRRILDYPPFARLVQLVVSGRQKSQTAEHAVHLGEVLRSLQAGSGDERRAVAVLGPAEAPLGRIADRFRWQILLKGRDAVALHRVVQQAARRRPELFRSRHVKVAVDVDPFSMM